MRTDGTKQLVAIEDGYRESTESWADPVAGPQAPGYAGAGVGRRHGWRRRVLGALREVFPATAGQRCWVHKVANASRPSPASAQPTARRMLSDIRDAEDRAQAVIAIKAFAEAYAVRYPRGSKQVKGSVPSLTAPWSTTPPSPVDWPPAAAWPSGLGKGLQSPVQEFDSPRRLKRP